MKYFGIALTIFRLSEACNTDDDCSSPYASCVSNVCECSYSFTLAEVQALDLANHVDITCNQNQIQVQLDQCVIEASRFQISELWLNGVVEANTNSFDTSADNNCVGQIVNSSGPFMLFDINTPLSECNSNLVSNGTHHIYQNAVQGWQGATNSIISRERKMFLQFECVFPATVQASANFAVNASLTTLQYTLDQEEGTYSAALALYTDSLLTTELLESDHVFVPDFFYGHITTDTPDSDRFVSKFENCWATPTNDPTHAVQHNFIVNGCPVLSGAAEADDDVQILQSGDGTEISFALRSFTWDDASLGDQVFVHCVASLCDFTQGDCSTAGCGLRKKRSSASTIPFEVMTVSTHIMKPTSCENGGFEACGKNSECYDDKNDYLCICNPGYTKVENSKHRCAPIQLKESMVFGYFD